MAKLPESRITMLSRRVQRLMIWHRFMFDVDKIFRFIPTPPDISCDSKFKNNNIRPREIQRPRIDSQNIMPSLTFLSKEESTTLTLPVYTSIEGSITSKGEDQGESLSLNPMTISQNDKISEDKEVISDEDNLW